MTDCIFCRIVRGDIPAHKIYEDEKVVAFLDIYPINPGHTLIVPKEHYERLDQVPPETLDAMIRAAARIAPAILRATGATGYNVVVNVGKSAGQEIMHVHLHVIPRREGDGCHIMHCARSKPSNEELAKTAEAIRRELGG
ncbi:histidine triad (HIT) protein [Pyrolobus fumarii 1A]|uniref:Histidine triad (HIT) protein n=1 Tax=Pyrolobus fumarii (strain DSM 11204 / 1A) TaxID=694429 RepID=G0EE23_PYRF1|nr:HIT family protein [Pyrolobus fumarii]AEM37939.1 histidine triad (HIT) protein [Pyrolobus fumarii 1A]